MSGMGNKVEFDYCTVVAGPIKLPPLGRDVKRNFALGRYPKHHCVLYSDVQVGMSS